MVAIREVPHHTQIYPQGDTSRRLERLSLKAVRYQSYGEGKGDTARIRAWQVRTGFESRPCQNRT